MEGVIEGRIVHYVLTQSDAEQINRRRTDSASIQQRIESKEWPIGVQAHIGNTAQAGDHCPMIIVRYWPNDVNGVNGQVFLDGNDSLWVTSAKYLDSDEPVKETHNYGTWHWVEKQ